MQIATHLNEIPTPSTPSGLTIGTFDGFHLGHQALVQTLKNQIGPEGFLTVLTFSNHPSTLFSPTQPVPLITTLEHKLHLLDKAGVDCALLLPFSKEFANQPFDSFLQELKSQLNFTHLVLGKGAAFGKHKQGDEAHVKQLAKQLSFEAHYLPKTSDSSLPVSSRRIRHHIAHAEFAAASLLLGRPYSIYTNTTDCQLDIANLCLPPDGQYPVTLQIDGQSYAGLALITGGQCRLQPSQPLPSHSKIEVIFSS